MNAKLWIVAAALLGASAVGLGAFAAHGLEKMLVKRGLPPDRVAAKAAQCETAVRHQLAHALAFLALGALVAPALGGYARTVANTAGALWLLGVLLFCGGLYALVFTEQRPPPLLIPAGGLLLLLGWLELGLLAFGRWRPPSDSNT